MLHNNNIIITSKDVATSKMWRNNYVIIVLCVRWSGYFYHWKHILVKFELKFAVYMLNINRNSYYVKVLPFILN